MSPDDLWVLGLRANEATGFRPRWMLVSFRQQVHDLTHHEPVVEAISRAAWGLTLPEDPEGGEEPFAAMVERMSGPEGEDALLCGPITESESRMSWQLLMGEEWDRLTHWQSEADWQRTLSHTYVLDLGTGRLPGTPRIS